MLRRIQDELLGIPGVVSASGADVALMTDSSFGNTLNILGYEPKGEDDSTNAYFNSVAPGFFETLGIPLVAGRDLALQDVDGAPKVAVVNEVFARRFFQAESPLGRRFGLGRRSKAFDYEIVGLVRDGKSASMRDEPKPFVYVPFMQDESVGGLTYYVRSSVKPDSFGAELRAAVARIDPTLPVTGLKTMRAQIGESLFVERMVATLSAAFGLLATLLAAIGLYGVTSYAVAERTREIGLRVALGADRRSVLTMVLKDVALLAAVGIAIGLPSGFGLARLVESQLFGLSARDPFTFATATLALVATVLVAGLIPAVRAARVDPMKALRYE
jgi:putative ABC transport system permease protein